MAEEAGQEGGQEKAERRRRKEERKEEREGHREGREGRGRGGGARRQSGLDVERRETHQSSLVFDMVFWARVVGGVVLVVRWW